MKKPRLFGRNWSAWRPHGAARQAPKPRRIAFEALESRCLLAVGLGSIADVTLPAGTTMYIPLAGSESGNTLNFAVTASDYSKLTPVVMPQTNQSLQLNLSVNGTTQTMTFQLFDNLAPNTAAAIESLVGSGFYNGLEIYRNGMDGSGNPFVLQGGNDPPTGAIKTDQPTMAEEFNPDLQFVSGGLLAMARQSTPSTSSTEFFVTEEAARFLDFNYTIFGCQTGGAATDQAIAAMTDESSTQDPNGIGYLVNPVTITSASIFTDTQNGVLQLRAPAGVTGTFTVTVTASDGVNVSTPVTFNVTVAADSSSNAANPFAGVTPAAPTSVAFVPPSGGSTQLTDLNNSSTGKELQFLVSGVTSGNTVEILADGNVIGQATAQGTSVTVTTNGSWDLIDGSHTITALQVAPDKTVSVTESGGSAATNQTADVPSLSSPAVQLTVDATPPQFDFTPVTVAVIGTAYSCQVATDDSTAVYALSQPPAGMTIDAASGLINWTPPAGQSSPVDVTVTATDPAGNVAQQSFEISVLPVNTPPALQPAAPTMGTTTEDAAVLIPLAQFIDNGNGTTTISDADQGAAIGGIALFGVTGNGTWEYSLDGTTFTAVAPAGIHSALLLDKDAVLRYTPDGKNGELASISYVAWDTTFGQDGGRLDLTLSAATSADSPVSTASDTAYLIVTYVNDAPVLTPAQPGLGSTTASAAVTISLATFINNGTGTTGISDVDNGAVLGGIAVTGDAGSGVWAYSTDGVTFTPLGAVSDSAALLLPSTAELRYTPNNSGSEKPTVTYEAWDTTSGAPGGTVDLSAAGATGGATAFSLAADTATLLVNDAPVLTPAAPSMGTTDENTAITVSLTGTFINHGSGTTITDPDANDAVGGIALTAVAGHGTWAYSLDGTTFTDVGTVSETSALLLPASAELRYTPDLANGETATISYQAWDATSGQAGGTADASQSGGATAFSSATDTASLTVTSVNDAPVLTPASPSMGTVVSTTAATIALAGTFINNGANTTSITDVDQGAVIGGIALIGVTGNGAWAYSLDGVTFTSVGTLSASAALLLPSTAKLQYTPTSDLSETATISYCAWDTTSGQPGSTADTTQSGGATAFSIATDTAKLVVNDAPVLTAAKPSLGSTILGTAVTFNLAGKFINNGSGTTAISDPDTGAVVGGIAVTGVSGAGTWAYSLDGTTFTSIITVSASSALLLPSTAELRYTPSSTVSETATITYCAWDATAGTAGGTADTTADGGATAFSTATDTASLVVAGGSISGYVYIDSDNDGLRIIPGGGVSLGLPGVIVELFSQGSSVATTTVLTGSDGSYHFDNLPAGTYVVQELQPSNYMEGKETLGTIGGVTTGTADQDEFQLTLAAGGNGSEYNFGELGLQTDLISLRLLLASAPSASQIIDQMDVAPAVYLSGSATAATYATTYTAGGSAVNVASSAATISAPNTSMLASLTVSIVNPLDGTSEQLAVDVSNTPVTSSYADGVLKLTGAASLAVYQNLLTAITYSDTASPATMGDRTIDVVANDGVVDSQAAVATVTVAPASATYSITADQSLIGATGATAASFTFANADVGETYNYSVTSGGGGTAVTGSGTISAANQQVTGINVSTLSDGTLTYSATLTDGEGNVGAAATATATLNQTAPSGYSVTADQGELNASGATAASFTFAGAEVGATYSYTVTSDGGGSSVTGSGTISSSGQQVTGINVSTLPDGTLTYSVNLTDAAGNSGSYVATTAILDTTAPAGYSITADQTTTINAAGAASTGFTLHGGEPYTSFTYVVTSTGGTASVTKTGTVLTDPQDITAIDVSTLPDGTLTYSVKLTDSAGNVGAAATATATLDRTAPANYSILADQGELGASEAKAASFTFTGAEVGATYTYTVTSGGGTGSVTGSGMISAADQQVVGINVSALPDGTLTYTVTLTDAVGNVGAAVTATATLDQTAPAGYSIVVAPTQIDATTAAATGFTLTGGEPYTTYNYVVTSSGGEESVTGSGTVLTDPQQVTGIDVSSLHDGTLTYSVTLTDEAGNVGAAATAPATLETGAPRGYSILADQPLVGASGAAAASFTFTGAELGATYNYTVTSGGGTGSVTGSGTIASPHQQVTGINVSSLPDGTLTYSVTLTDALGNVGAAATAAATLDQTPPAGYSIVVDQSQIDSTNDTATSFTFTGAELLATYNYTVTSDGGTGSVAGTGAISSADQQVTGIDVSPLPAGNLTYSVTLTDPAGNVGAAVTAPTVAKALAAVDSALAGESNWLS